MSSDGRANPVPGSVEEQAEAVLAALLPGLRHLITVAIRDAVAAERERCAQVADSFSSSQWAEPKRIVFAIREGP